MFVPSKIQFPLPRTELANGIKLEDMKECNKCNSAFITWQPVVQGSIPNNTYKIFNKDGDYDIKPALKYVCPNCRRWQYFGMDNFLYSFGDLVKKSRDEWNDIKTELYLKYPEHIALFLYKELRRERLNILSEYDWEQYFGKKTVALIWGYINELMEDYNYVDNIRVASSNIKSQVRRYKKQKDKGCCGSFDTIVNGYMIGFNYGH